MTAGRLVSVNGVSQAVRFFQFPHPKREVTVTKTKKSQDLRQQTQSVPQPGFKPVALPALKAAVHASRKTTQKKKTNELPAILRKEAQLG